MSVVSCNRETIVEPYVQSSALPWSHFSDIEQDAHMPVFQSPGLADSHVNQVALSAWNARVAGLINRQGVSPFMVLDPRDIRNGQNSKGFRWSANPREPLDCLGAELATKLCDLGWSGRAELHNEYLEYGLVMRPDSTGRLRPKRFVATTELMEWWMTMAVFDLEYFLTAAEAVSGRLCDPEEIFGVSTSAWAHWDIAARKACFQRRLVGKSSDTSPEHPLNVEHLLFMSNRHNRLKDMILAMHAGSFPYVVPQAGDKRIAARLDEVFSFLNKPEYLGRNATSTVAQRAHHLAYIPSVERPQGRAFAFSDPLGVYIRSFASDRLSIDGSAIPTDWVRYSRGASGMPMRLEFGPDDQDPRFLDNVQLGQGSIARFISGYALSQLIEVGPLVTVAAERRPITQVEFVPTPALPRGQMQHDLLGAPRSLQLSDFADRHEHEISTIAASGQL
ncbi:MAG: hypothetical protein AAGB28_17680 [Pseudomonadota bacterium]